MQADRVFRPDRVFGLVWAAVFLLIGLAPARHGQPAKLWALSIGAALLAMAAACPSILHPLNVIWTGLGRVLHRVMSPVAAAVLFYLVVTPAGMLRRFHKDPLRLRFDPSADTYWIPRQGRQPEWWAF